MQHSIVFEFKRIAIACSLSGNIERDTVCKVNSVSCWSIRSCRYVRIVVRLYLRRQGITICQNDQRRFFDRRSAGGTVNCHTANPDFQNLVVRATAECPQQLDLEDAVDADDSRRNRKRPQNLIRRCQGA